MLSMKIFEGNATLAESYIATVKAAEDDLSKGLISEGSRKLLALEASMQTVLAIGDGCDAALPEEEK